MWFLNLLKSLFKGVKVAPIICQGRIKRGEIGKTKREYIIYFIFCEPINVAYVCINDIILLC